VLILSDPRQRHAGHASVRYRGQTKNTAWLPLSPIFTKAGALITRLKRCAFLGGSLIKGAIREFAYFA